MKPTWDGRMKLYSNGPVQMRMKLYSNGLGQMTKMAAVPI